MSRIVRSLLPALLVCAAPLRAQDAVVLSGGGARGLAHVGAVMHLEATGYDPEIVVGNSMGAVVGALYAAGYGPDEIRDRVLAIRWGQMFDAAPVVVGPDRALRLPAVRIDLDVAHRRFSRGLFGEWRVNRALVHLLFDAGVRSGGDFDRLPRRYRAVAADLTTGAEVVLDRGDLARATRASMAYPGFFAPVRWGERVLVDGGIVNNFPTDVARRLGARRVVGVDVSRAPDSLGTPTPLVVVQRSLDLMQQNLHRDPVPPDALILPLNEAGFGGLAFPEDPQPVIEEGLAAARRDLPAGLPVGPRVRRPLITTPASFSAVIVEATDSALAAYTRRAFADVIGRPYDPAAVLRAVDRLYTTGLFDGVWPSMTAAANATAAPPLLVRIDAPPRVTLALGAHYENDRGGRIWATVDRNAAIGRRPAVYSIAGTAGGLDRWAALSARLYTTGNPAFTWSIGAHVREQHMRSFAEDARTTTESLRTGGWLALELPHILRERLVSALVRAEWIDIEEGAAGLAIGPLVRFSSVQRAATVVGAPFLLEAERRWGALGYTRVAFTGTHTIGSKRTRAAGTIDVRGVSSHAPLDVQPSLGDDHAIPGLRWGEFRGRARIVTGADLALPLRSGYVRLRARTGSILQELDELDRSHWITGGQAGIYWPTPLGIVEAGWGLATRGDGRFDVSVGRSF